MRTQSIFSRSVGLLVGVLSVLSLGCERKPPPSAFVLAEAPPVSPEAFNFAVAVTRGNHTYIPVNAIQYGPYQVRILELVAAFEQAHPEFEVLYFELKEVKQDRSGSTTYISGLWLHHRPKPKT